MTTAPEPSQSDYQSQGLAWHPRRPDICDQLYRARHVRLRSLYAGSNQCYLVTLEHDGERSLAVYKPAAGEYPLYDFPAGTLYRREVATSLVDRLLGWELVPPTVETDGRYGVGSLQLFIEDQGQGEIELAELRRLVLLDVILNNADRKTDHCLVGEGGKLWAIDHGLTFHTQPKLRTILWHFAGQPLEDDERADLQMLLCTLERGGREVAELRKLINQVEFHAFRARVKRTIEENRLPNPRYKSMPYRW